ncbi:hypothetical protein [Clostridium tarantellae]|uniref:Uncharacterized protein n=1 Tax=Clostridium tarantellae TaxID=39493 RepID=A0A6I1MKB6_9CLOT|nr:hypothetical protein [Clostridium tarantellae]MPQ43470.1 hypothetical protein [Clostridium tarantellae]
MKFNDLNNREELKKEFEKLETSESALNMIILSLILSSININKSKIEILDKINKTNYADKLQNSKNIEKLSNELRIIGSSISWNLARNTLKDRRKDIYKCNTLEVKDKFNYANKDYILATLYFLAAIIDCC